MNGPSLPLGGRGCSCGDLDHHLQTAAILARRGEDPPAVQLFDAAAYRETKTAALVVRARVVEADETPEDARTYLKILEI